jgi:beta-glucanase (GH16 family)
MKKSILLLIPVIVFTLTLCSSSDGPPKPIRLVELDKTPKKVTYSFDKKVTWADEFDSDGKPNLEIWNYDLGGGGWGNNESQVYTNELENARVENGNLIIEAKTNSISSSYTSARLVTKNKKDFLYGRIEIKALLPIGMGTWPAIWTLATADTYGNAYWPDNGEMDIMEHVGFDQDRVHANIHTKAFNHSIGTNKGNNRIVEKASEEFHLYRLDWYPDKVEFYIDDKQLFQFQKLNTYGWQEWPFDKAQHLLLNIAVGGNWGGMKGIDKSIFPQKMLIDYVRFYKLIETAEN